MVLTLFVLPYVALSVNRFIEKGKALCNEHCEIKGSVFSKDEVEVKAKVNNFVPLLSFVEHRISENILFNENRKYANNINFGEKEFVVKNFFLYPISVAKLFYILYYNFAYFAMSFLTRRYVKKYLICKSRNPLLTVGALHFYP